MTDRVFIDTNVLIYGRDTKQAAKRGIAQDGILRLTVQDSARINLQVRNELTRWLLKNEAHRPLADIQEEVDALRLWGDKPLGEDEFAFAWRVRESLGYQWFDCLPVAAAHLQGCRYFLTEDMAHGAVFKGMTLLNPFRASPDDVLRRN
jgi:predicted nucleic acid-binding protein